MDDTDAMQKKLIESQYLFSPIELRLEQIRGMHPALANITSISSNLEYLLESVIEVNSDYFLQFLQLHPIILIEEENKYYCINNHRAFQIANILLPGNQLLNCKLILNFDLKKIITLGQSDFFLSHLLFSLRPQDADDQLCRLWNELDSDLKRAIMPDTRHQTLLAKLLKNSRNQTYIRRKKINKNNNDSSK